MKRIDIFKSNNVLKLSCIGEFTWRLFSAIYDLGWNSLFADQSKNLFRQKVIYKCTLAIKPMVNSKKEEKSTDKPDNIGRIPPLIPAKLPKEVKEIFQVFQDYKVVKQYKEP